jgi:hypothetical protein
MQAENALPDLMREVESPEFDARLNVISGLSHFCRVAIGHRLTRQLVEQLAHDDNFQMVRNRANELLGERPSGDEGHNWDVALAIYILALSEVKVEPIRSLLEELEQERACWWARRVAAQILFVLRDAAHHSEEPDTRWGTLLERFGGT